MLKNRCSDLAFVGILGPVAGTASFDPGQGRGESPSDFGVRPRLATHAAVGAGGWWSALGERVAHLEQIVEQQAARIAALEQELARRQGRSRRGAQASASSDRSDRPRRRRSSGRSPGGPAGARRPWPGADAGRARGPVDPGQARRLPPMRAAAHGRGPPSAASPAGRDPAGASRGPRVSAAHAALSGLRPC